MIERIQKFDKRRLSKINSSYIPPDWLFFDSETKERTVNGITSQRFYMGWTCYYKRSLDGKQVNETWKFWKSETALCKYIHDLTIKRGHLNLLGHNIYFDLQACGFFLYFTRWGWVLDFIYDKGMTYILRCTRNKRVLTALSTTNWYDQSLKKLGSLIGLKKLDVTLDTISDKYLKVYCKRDVEIIVEAMKYYFNFITEHDLGKFSLTKSSQAYTAFRHRFMSQKILIHNDELVTNIERLAYFGGRTECFFLGQVKGRGFMTLDINAMYPYVMSTYSYPYDLVEYNKHKSVDFLKKIVKTHGVIATVIVDTPEPAYAVNYNKKTVFPIGRFECTLCTTGIKYALKNGHIKEIKNIAVYLMADIFSPYVNYLHSVRLDYQKEDNEVITKLCKYLENSLYGKFAQKKIVRDEFEQKTGRAYYKQDGLYMDTGERFQEIKLLNKLIIIHPEIENPASFPGLAAHITENARFLLWDLIKTTGRKKVLYCDTDCIKIRSLDLKYVAYKIDKNILGALKVENETKKLYIGGNKYYITEQGRHIKGIPASAVEIKPGLFEYKVFLSQDKHLKNEQMSGFNITTSRRQVRTAYDKGNVLPDGTITPLVF